MASGVDHPQVRAPTGGRWCTWVSARTSISTTSPRRRSAKSVSSNGAADALRRTMRMLYANGLCLRTENTARRFSDQSLRWA